MQRVTTSYLFGVGLLFFLSGISGLVYQVLWLRLLSLTFGVTIYAATTVLASFMAGLGVGSLAGGWLSARTRRPLLLFGLAELCIAIVASVTPAALDVTTSWYAALHAAFAPSTGAITFVRFLSSLVVLLAPTVLMGASLPILVRTVIDGTASTRRRVGLLYTCNTTGAIVGALVTGFFLIGSVGISRAFQVAVAINLLVGLGAVLLSQFGPLRFGDAVQATDVRTAATSVNKLSTPERRVRHAVLVIIAISGLAALALEVIWYRILVLLVPATTYAFTTMLAAVLGGIAAGSAAATRLTERKRNWPVVLASVEVGIGVAAIASMSLLGITYAAGWRTSGTIQASVLAIVPTTFLMGFAFPIGVLVYTGDRSDSSAPTRVGTLYAVNVVGAIIGCVVAGFVLLPNLGSRLSLIAVASLQVTAGCALYVVTLGAPRALLRITLAATLTVAPSLLLPDPFATAMSRRHLPDEHLLWNEEGIQTTVAITRIPTGQRTMYLDGLHQANDSAEMLVTHRGIGHLPMLLHPRPAKALVVGLGGGTTAGAVAQHRGASVDLVELSDSVVRGAAWFQHVNGDVLRQPNVRLHLNDGRNHLLLSGRKYDVITADIIQPIHAGAGHLYSIEYFELARQALNDNGILLQWIGHRDALHYALIMRTFLRVFPYATLWADGTLMVGSKAPLEIRESTIAAKFEDPSLRKALSSIGITDVASVLRLYTAGPTEMRRFVGQGVVLSDDRPLLEYHRSLPAGERPLDLSRLRGAVSDVLR